MFALDRNGQGAEEFAFSANIAKKGDHYASDIVYRFGCSMATRVGCIPRRERADSSSVDRRGYFLDPPLRPWPAGKLKLYTMSNHPDGTVHKTKAEAEKAEEEHHTL